MILLDYTLPLGYDYSARSVWSLKLFANLNAKQKGLVLVLIPVLFQLFVSMWLTVQLRAAASELLNLDGQRARLMQLERTGGTGARVIFTVGNLARNQDSHEALVALQSARRQLEADPDFRGLSKLASGESLDSEASAFRREMVKLIEQSLKVLGDPSLKAGDRFSVLRSQLFSAGMSFENLSRSIVKLESSSKSIEPAKLSELRSGITVTLFVLVFLCLIVTVTLTYLFARDIVARLALIGANASLLARDERLPAATSGRDEIALLDGILHDTGRAIAKMRREERAVLANTSELVCTLDEKLKFQSMNSAAERLWNVEKDGLMQQSLLSLLPEAKALQVRRQFDEVRRAGKGELETSLKDGRGKWKVLRWSVLWREDKLLFNCVGHDVSEKRHIERLKQQLVAVVSHDLRTPIASLWISISAMATGKRGALPAEAVERLSDLETKLAELSSLMDRLLEIDRLSSGRALLEKDVLHTYNIVAQAVENCAEQAANRGVKVHRPQSDAYVEAEEQKLIQAFTELLRFSVGRAPVGSTVHLHIVSRDQLAVITFSDSGPVLAAEARKFLLKNLLPSSAPPMPLTLSVWQPLGL